jgi:CRP-like cAMP-binding protein
MTTGLDFREILLRSPLLSEMDEPCRQALALRFEARPFSKGQMLMAIGSEGRELLEVLAGTADVHAVEGQHRFRVAILEPGSLVGELAFFDPHAPRSAEVVGTSEGIIAALPHTAYQALAADRHPAAAALEQAIMAHTARRLRRTNQRLGRLLDAHRTGTLVDALGRIFGRATPAPGVLDG